MATALAAVTLAGCGGSDSGDNAKADAKTACDLLDRMGTLHLSSKRDSSYYEFGAAVTLAQGAAERDSQYKPLREALERASNAMQQKYDAHNPITRDGIAKAKDLCADL